MEHKKNFSFLLFMFTMYALTASPRIEQKKMRIHKEEMMFFCLESILIEKCVTFFYTTTNVNRRKWFWSLNIWSIFWLSNRFFRLNKQNIHSSVLKPNYWPEIKHDELNQKKNNERKIFFVVVQYSQFNKDEHAFITNNSM